MYCFAEVILPLALPQNYTYRVPKNLEPKVQAGVRVVVQFGRRKLYTALVAKVHQKAPKDFKPKDLLDIEDESPIVGPNQFKLWQWLADYYLCSQGEVMTAALPSGLKLESEMVVLPNQLKTLVDEELNDLEFLVMEALQQQNKLSIKEISAITELANPLRLIKNLLGKRYILLEEEIKGGYRPVQKRWVRLAPSLGENALNLAFADLEKAPKQRDLLLAFFSLKGAGERVSAVKLLKQTKSSDGSLQSLAKKGLIELFYDAEVKPIAADGSIKNLPILSPVQSTALHEIKAHWQNKEVCLLHGVTSSGKTEIYSQLIAEVLQKGQQVLYLVPEIALTTQLIGRLQKHFGEQVLVYHSRFSDRERVESWLELAENQNKPKLIIGARSSVFLPFGQIGLVIVDEEHETSYKQFDPAPRYHARDTAIVLAASQGAKVLLGSATPSLESYYNAQAGKYGLVEVWERYGNLPLPEITCVDLKEARRKKRLHGAFTEDLQLAIEATLKAKKQVILFQNRRGFSTFIQCKSCAYVMQCQNCDISLTYHKYSNNLRCHYCGYQRKIPQRCPACNSHEINSLGFGTEKLEDDLRLMFPKARVQRMDLDTTRKKNAYHTIISDFEDGETDILVGTQMVTKGLDFGNVSLVGIMNADALLNFPDFRSHERAFQLIAQVAGRAGRKGERGSVIVQTSEPYHHVIRKVMDNQYQQFFKEELAERKQFHYPPSYRIIKLTLKHRDKAHLENKAKRMGIALRKKFGDRILGPEFPLVARLRNQYLMEIILKLEGDVHRGNAKLLLRKTIEDFEIQNPERKVQVVFDVDPY
jgi:primosomal protein N' (replication factor Y)